MTDSRHPEVVLTASVDTEEDNWVAARTGVTVSNIAALPAMHERVSGWGLRVTYFTAYSVADDDSAAAIMRDVKAAGGEIGAHLHPWNTPPLDEPMAPEYSMLKNLPGDLQRRKIARLTERIAERFGAAPTVFRAGRFALGSSTVPALLENGYRVDSSVMPGVDWSDTDAGPDFSAAPLDVYRISSGAAVTTPTAHGELVEVPLSMGYNRWPFSRWRRIHRWFSRGLPRTLRLGAIAARSGLVRPIAMSPEGSGRREVRRLAKLLVDHGARHVQVIWHSPSNVPGFTPFTRTARDVDAFYRTIADVVDALHSMASVKFATIGETARLLGEGNAAR